MTRLTQILYRCAQVVWIAVIFMALMYAPKALSISAYPAQSFEPATIRITLHIERVPENRQLVWVCDSGDGMRRSSEYQLEGEHSQATFEVFWQGVSAGSYECRAGLGRMGESPIYATARFTVIGR